MDILLSNKVIKLFVILITFFSYKSQAQNVNEYRTRASGDWSDVAVWERFNGSSWVTATETPTSSNADRTAVRRFHSVSITTNVDIDQFRTAGAVTVSSGGVFHISNGDDVDISIVLDGTITVQGTMELQNAVYSGFTGTNVVFNSGSRYRHLFTSITGVPPLATWDINSTLEIAGYTSSLEISGTNWDQTYGNVEINCTALPSSGIVSMAGRVNNILGNLIFTSSGAGQVRLNNSQTSTVNVGGDLSILNDANININRDGNLTLNIAGDFYLNTSRNTLMAASGQTTVNLTGSFIMENAVGTIVNCGISSGRTVINLEGDVELISGSITELGLGSEADINFIGDGTIQYLTRPGGSAIISNTINFSVSVNSTLDLTNYSIIGDGELTVSGTLRLGGLSSDGAIQASPASSGNVRNTGARTFNAGSTIVYNGSAQQYLGTGHPGAAYPDVDLVLDNVNGLSFASSVSEINVTGDLNLSAGDLNVDADKSLILDGNIIQASTNENITVTSTSDITINGTGALGTFPFPVGEDQTFRDFTLNRSSGNVTFENNVVLSGTFTMSAGDLLLDDYQLTISGAYQRVSGGLSTNSNSSITIDGAGSLSYFEFLPGSQLNSFSISRAGESTGLLSALELINLLSVENGSTFASDGFLTLVSTGDDPLQDAKIGSLLSGSAVTGDVTIQRFMSQEGNLNRYISSPVQSASVADLQDDFSITGSFSGTSYPCTGCSNNGASMKWYKENVSGSISQGYLGFPTSSNAETLTVGRGYLAWMWEDIQITWDLTGNINSGDIDLNVSHTPSSPANPDADGWNLVGNPYPSPVIWNDGAGWSKSGIAPVIYVPDNASGVYRTWDAGSQSGDLPNGIVAMGQAFWVYAENAGASLAINEQAKSLSSGSFFREGKDTQPILTVSLQYESFIDNSFIAINQDATQAYDRGLDAPKLEGELFSVSVIADSKKCVRYVTDEVENVVLDVKAANSGQYTLRFEGNNNFLVDRYFLKDKYTGKVYDLSGNKNIDFYVDENPSSKGSRFILGTMEIKKGDKDDLIFAMYPNPVDDVMNVIFDSGDVAYISLIDSKGAKTRVDLDLQKYEGYTHAKLNLSNLRSGIYLLVCEVNGKVMSKRVIKK